MRSEKTTHELTCLTYRTQAAAHFYYHLLRTAPVSGVCVCVCVCVCACVRACVHTCDRAGQDRIGSDVAVTALVFGAVSVAQTRRCVYLLRRSRVTSESVGKQNRTCISSSFLRACVSHPPAFLARCHCIPAARAGMQ